MTGILEGVSDAAWGPDVNRTMPEFGSLFGSVGHFFSNAAKAAGKELGHAGTSLQKAGGAIGSAVKKIPVVGAPISTVMTVAYHAVRAPVDVVVDTAIKHRRLDHVLLGKLHEQVQDVKAVAPYAKSVISMVPGVGTGVAAAIGAASALASGQPIDKALMAAVLDAVPGGAMAKAAASAASAGIDAAVHGRKLDIASVTGTLMAGLPIPDSAKAALTSGIHMTGELASGKKIDAALADTLIKTGLANLPSDVKNAFHTGLAAQAGAVMQTVRAAHLPDIHGKLIESGLQLAKTLPVVGEARKLAGAGSRGYDLGHGLVAQRAHLFDIMHVRSQLAPHDQKGFDMALATRIGMVAHPPEPKLSPAAQAGRVIAHGVHGMAHAGNRTEILATLKAHPSASVGARVAEQHIARAHEMWPVKVLRTLKAGVLHLAHH